MRTAAIVTPSGSVRSASRRTRRAANPGQGDLLAELAAKLIAGAPLVPAAPAGGAVAASGTTKKISELRRGDVFYIWNEQGRAASNRIGMGYSDRAARPRLHVQADPRPAGSGRCDVDVLVDGRGRVVSRYLEADLLVDVEDPAAVPWQQAEDTFTTAPLLGGPVGSSCGDDGLDRARVVLARCTWSSNVLTLPAEDLDRPVWEAVHAVLTGMDATGGSRKGQPYRFASDRRADLEAFIAGGPAPKPERTTMGWVRTPDALAADVVARFVNVQNLPDRVRVLEPSAGDGALVRAVTAAVPGAVEVTVVEPNPERFHRVNKLPSVVSWHNGTLEEYVSRHTPGAPGFDLVVMNPPYSVPGKPYLWAEHLELAWGMLADGGQLVAIVPISAAREPRGKAGKVLEMLGPGIHIEALPQRSFRESGTDFDTCVLTVVKGLSVVEGARRRHAHNVYRPAEGEPVRVERPDLTVHARRERPVQAYRDFGGERVVRFVGVCIGCSALTWGLDDGDNDPRGMLGLAAVYPFRAEEYDMAGPDVCMCSGCANSGIMYDRAATKARALWTARPAPVPVESLLFDPGAWGAALEASLVGEQTPD